MDEEPKIYPPSTITKMSAVEAIETAFDMLGGIPRLVTWAQDNYEKFITQVYPRVIPSQERRQAENPTAPVMEVSWLSPKRLQAPIDVTPSKSSTEDYDG